MATGILAHTHDSPLGEAHSLFAEPHWYAAYTRANHEKQVAGQLARRGVDHFLPLYQTVHRRKDRRVHLNLPLFPSYVFVRLPLRDRLQVLQIPGLVHLVGFGGLPTTLPEQEIETLRKGLKETLRALPHPYLTVGRQVRIKDGPLAGVEGILRRRKGNWRVVLSVDLIQRSIAVETESSNLAILPMRHRSFPI
jgi:transcription antitermination factor NusG